MGEWWTYRPQDFLMFSPRVYARLFELVNADAWPAPPLLAAAALAWALAAWRRPGPGLARAGLLGAAAAWAWVGWDFVATRFAPVNWPAAPAAWAFGAQALLLAAFVWRPPAFAPQPPRRAGLALVAAGAVLLPLLAPLSGRPWAQAEVVGLAPAPTVVVTLGLLVALRAPVLAWALPVAAVAAGTVMGAMLGRADTAVLLLALGVALWARRRGGPVATS